MKSMVIFVVLLMLMSNVVYARDVVIPETFETAKAVSDETTYFYAGSKLLASKNSFGVNYHYQDRLGSDVYSKSLPFGQSLEIGERFSFTGKELDEDLYYFNARYYDSSLGRFTSVDPIEGELAYGYVMNNPMNLVDPSGMAGEGLFEDVSSDSGFKQDSIFDIPTYSPSKEFEKNVLNKNFQIENSEEIDLLSSVSILQPFESELSSSFLGDVSIMSKNYISDLPFSIIANYIVFGHNPEDGKTFTDKEGHMVFGLGTYVGSSYYANKYFFNDDNELASDALGVLAAVVIGFGKEEFYDKWNPSHTYDLKGDFPATFLPALTNFIIKHGIKPLF